MLCWLMNMCVMHSWCDEVHTLPDHCLAKWVVEKDANLLRNNRGALCMLRHCYTAKDEDCEHHKHVSHTSTIHYFHNPTSHSQASQLHHPISQQFNTAELIQHSANPTTLQRHTPLAQPAPLPNTSTALFHYKAQLNRSAAPQSQQ